MKYSLSGHCQFWLQFIKEQVRSCRPCTTRANIRLSAAAIAAEPSIVGKLPAITHPDRSSTNFRGRKVSITAIVVPRRVTRTLRAENAG